MANAPGVARQICPKRMRNGPCGGVRPGGACEVDPHLACPYLAELDVLPWRGPRVPHGRPPRRGEGRLEEALRTGRFAVVAEAYATDSADLGPLVSRYASIRDRITAVNVADHALAVPHASPASAAVLFERAGIEAVLNVTCRDRNRIGLQGDLLGAAALGIRNVFCVTGDHPALGDEPEAKGVFDLDSLELVSLARSLCDEERLPNGRGLETAPRLFVGAAANPFATPVALQAERVAAKVSVGADFIQTQAVFDTEGFSGFVDQLRDFGALRRTWLIAGVAIVASPEGARWLQREVPGARVPDSLVSSLARTPAPRRRNAGLEHTADIVARLREMPGISGVLLFPLLGDVESTGELLELIPR